MTPFIITSVLTIILFGMIIWLQFTPKENQKYFKIGAALVLILLVWMGGDHGKIYYSTLISILVLSIIYKEYFSLRKLNVKE